MGINTFTTALSGLSTNTQGLNVVGNNLANMNTVGFKSTSINFTDVLGQTVSSSGGTSGQVGLGGQIGRVSTNFIQGGLETTNNPTDLAIQGNGFFVVNEGQGNFYTRAGNFSVDAEGQLVAATGHAVQGWVRDPTTGLIDTSSTLANIRLPVATAGANPTANFELAFNLDAPARYVVKRLRSDIPPVSTLVGIAVSVIRFHLAILFNTNHSGSVFQLSWPLCSRDTAHDPYPFYPLLVSPSFLRNAG